jgi:outer membrane receptor protein involved in Fe transport
MDYTPYEGGLASLSFFHKNIEDAIEYVAVGSQEFQFTTALNYPKGELSGWEFEVRHRFDGAAEGLGIGANATLIDSEVFLTPFEIEQFATPGVAVDLTSREMTNAPEHLYNLYTTYDLEKTGTNLALFYTVQGDTLVEGAGIDNGNFVPSVFQREYDTLNFSASQDLGSGLRLKFQAKNLTNPLIERVYRHESIGDDVTRASFTRGIEYSISLSLRMTF